MPADPPPCPQRPPPSLSAVLSDQVLEEPELRRELVRAYIAGYGRAVEDARAALGGEDARRRRSPWRWVGVILGLSR